MTILSLHYILLLDTTHSHTLHQIPKYISLQQEELLSCWITELQMFDALPCNIFLSFVLIFLRLNSFWKYYILLNTLSMETDFM